MGLERSHLEEDYSALETIGPDKPNSKSYGRVCAGKVAVLFGGLRPNSTNRHQNESTKRVNQLSRWRFPPQSSSDPPTGEELFDSKETTGSVRNQTRTRQSSDGVVATGESETMQRSVTGGGNC